MYDLKYTGRLIRSVAEPIQDVGSVYYIRRVYSYDNDTQKCTMLSDDPFYSHSRARISAAREVLGTTITIYIASFDMDKSIDSKTFHSDFAYDLSLMIFLSCIILLCSCFAGCVIMEEKNRNEQLANNAPVAESREVLLPNSVTAWLWRWFTKLRRMGRIIAYWTTQPTAVTMTTEKH